MFGLRSFVRSVCTSKCLRSAGSAKSIKTPVSVFGIEGRYASALYSAAHQMNQLEAVETHLMKVLKEIETVPKMKDFILAVDVPAVKKAEAFKHAGEKTGMPAAATNFLSLVAENGRLKELKKMITLFITIMAAHKGEVQCEVTTAKPLDESTLKKLRDVLAGAAGGKKVRLEQKVEPAIIGGMIVSIDDKVVDMSISRKINMYTDIIKQAV